MKYGHFLNSQAHSVDESLGKTTLTHVLEYWDGVTSLRLSTILHMYLPFDQTIYPDDMFPVIQKYMHDVNQGSVVCNCKISEIT